MTKHEEEVRFLEAAAGLELTIMDLQGEKAQQERLSFQRTGGSSPQAPTAPQSQEPERPIAPPEKVLYRAKLSKYASALNPIDKTAFSKEKGMFRGKVNAGWNLDRDNYSSNPMFQDCILESNPFVFSRMVPTHNENVKIRCERKNAEARAKYESDMRTYEQNLAAYRQRKAEYDRELTTYNQQMEQRENTWLAVQKTNLQTLTTTLDAAQEQLAALYTGARILPKPYQYPEAVLYLYEFLSSSSDDYDIKYALERVDANEMKRLMAALIQDQSRQARIMTSIMSSVQLELGRLGNTVQQQQAIAQQQLSVSEQSLQDSQRFLLHNTDIVGRLKLFPQ